MVRTLEELVRDRPLPDGSPSFCPMCGSTELATESHRLTTVGTIGVGDSNHHWYGERCVKCSLTFTREVKCRRVWYTRNGKLLAGIPSCSENYVYTCNLCGGDVRRRYTGLSGKKDIHVLGTRIVSGREVRDYRIFFRCDGCGSQVEADEDRLILNATAGESDLRSNVSADA